MCVCLCVRSEAVFQTVGTLDANNTMNVHEMPRLCLFESFTLPLLTYGCDGLLLPRVYVNKLNVCWNNVYRKIYNMRMRDSVKEIQLYCKRLDLVRILHKRSFIFLQFI